MVSTHPAPLLSSSSWDDPVLTPYAAREACIEDSTLDDEEEVERQLIEVWREAVHAHPTCAGAYQRLASALRDAKQNRPACEVLRQGVRMGHPALLGDLITDYPELATDSEIEQALGQPSLVKWALLAMLAQDHTDAAMHTVSQLVEAQAHGQDNGPFPFREVTRLVGALIQSNRLAEAQQVQELVAGLRHARLPQVFPRLLEIVTTSTWLDPDLRSGLVHLELQGNTGPLECSLEQLSPAQRADFFATLRRECPLLAERHQPALHELRQGLLGSRSLVAGLFIAAAVFGAAGFFLLTHR